MRVQMLIEIESVMQHDFALMHCNATYCIAEETMGMTSVRMPDELLT